MGFGRIIGHENIVNFLKTAIKKDRLAHAYLFEGCEGTGRVLTAIEFSKAINCKSNLNDGCEKCSACIKINNNNHPDVNIIEPIESSIKNKQIEEFQKSLLLKPYESKKKIFIIKSADTMTISAQNSLLKVLEEPPEYAIIILVVENSYGLLPTIKSRCQILKFNRIPNNKIEKYLVDNCNISVNESKILTAFSDGSIGNALKLHSSEDFKSRREKTIEIIDKIIQGDKLSLLDSIDFFEKNKGHIDEILNFFTIWFRDMLLIMETKEEKYLFNIDKIDILKRHVINAEYDKTVKYLEGIEKTRKNINSNVNFGLCIETMLFNF